MQLPFKVNTHPMVLPSPAKDTVMHHSDSIYCRCTGVLSARYMHSDLVAASKKIMGLFMNIDTRP